MYQHLTIEERYHIQAYKKAGYKNIEIAREINKHPSTISREIKRNCSTIQKRYSASSADKVARLRRRYASSQSNKKMNKDLENKISENIRKDWSPEQVSAMLEIKDNINISFVRIYQFIEQDKINGGDLYTHLRFYHTGHRRAKYGAKYKGQIEDRVSISQRPDIVNKMTRIGDFQGKFAKATAIRYF